MLVHTMTPEELSKEILRDYGNITHFKLPLLAEEYDRERKKKKIRHEKQYPIFKEITSDTNNKWIILFNKMASAPRYRGLKDLSLVFLCYMSTANGFRYFKVLFDGGITIYNQHFFQRYNLRMELELINHLDIIKDYFIHNGNTVYKVLDTLNERNEEDNVPIIGISIDGYSLGVMNKKNNWIISRTFITKDQAYIDQEEDEAETLLLIQKQLENFIANNEDDIEILKLKDIFAGIKSNN
jgi:hypothetical protein